MFVFYFYFYFAVLNRAYLNSAPSNFYFADLSGLSPPLSRGSMSHHFAVLVEAFDMVTVSFDRMAFLILHDKKLYKEITEFFGHTILEQWNIVGEFLKALHEHKPHHCRFFIKLGEQITKKSPKYIDS